MKYTHILALDPSGNFHEGKGSTGVCLWNTETNKLEFNGVIQAQHFSSMEEYWNNHLKAIKYLLTKSEKAIIVIEDYLLYANKANNQINSKMETPKLIGVLQHYLWSKKIPYVMQNASEVKNRWSDDILVHKGILIKKGNRFKLPKKETPVNRHTRDAIRHAIHFSTFKNKGG